MTGEKPNIQAIAEFACIHEGDKKYLLRLAQACRESGADAVKFQCFDPKEVVAPTHPDYLYLKSISFSADLWSEIIQECASMGLGVWVDLSGLFSVKVAKAAGQALTGVKIHSSEVQNPSIIKAARELNRPVMIGCGGTPLIDLFELLDLLGSSCPVIFMHGFQSFPKKEGAKGGPPSEGVTLKDLELWRIQQLKHTFPQAEVGIAEHIAGEDPLAIQIPSWAAAMGARYIEKHVTLDRTEQREDYFSALEPDEFRLMVDALKKVSVAIGENLREMGRLEKGYQQEMKRSANAAKDLKPGETIRPESLALKRDGNYRCTASLGRVLDRKLIKPLSHGEMLTMAHVEAKVGIFCNSRSSSSRLPQKALLPLYDRYTTLGYLLKRLISYPTPVGEVVLATTRLPDDNCLEDLAKEIGVPCLRGEPEDVMGRMVQTAEAFGWDTFVRVTGDDQFVSYEYIEKALHHHLTHSLDYTRLEGLPVGMDCEIIDVRTLKKIHRAVADRTRTEYFTWFFDSEWTCRNGILQVEPQHRHPDFRLTLDYKEDYELMRELARRCHAKTQDFYIPINLLLAELLEMNPSWRPKNASPALKRHEVDTRLIYQYSHG